MLNDLLTIKLNQTCEFNENCYKYVVHFGAIWILTNQWSVVYVPTSIYGSYKHIFKSTYITN